MGYVACKTIKVDVGGGNIEIRHKGDPIPEAAQFANPEVWVRRGYIEPTDIESGIQAGYYRSKLKPMRPATKADEARSASKVPQPGQPLPELAAPAPADPAPEPKPVEPATPQLMDDPVKEAEEAALKELMDMKRDELNAFASENTMLEDPASYPNKEALAKAILESAGG